MTRAGAPVRSPASYVSDPRSSVVGWKSPRTPNQPHIHSPAPLSGRFRIAVPNVPGASDVSTIKTLVDHALSVDRDYSPLRADTGSRPAVFRAGQCNGRTASYS